MTEPQTDEVQNEEPESPSLDEVIADAPEVTPAEDPITPESVQSDKAPEESLPDSSLVSDRLQAIVESSASSVQSQADAQQHADNQEELRLLRLLRAGEATPPSKEPEKDDESALYKGLVQDMVEIKAENAEVRGELARRHEEQVMLEAQKDVVSYITDQKEHFPMLNETGYQVLAYQKMVNEKNRTGTYLSEAQAGREVEAEIVSIVEQCAPLLGFTKSHEEPKREEQVSVGTGSMGVADPLDTDNLSDDQMIDHLVTQFDNNQR
jgi:hypothetical protein